MKKLITLLFVTFILVGCSNASTKTITLDEAQEIALAEVDGKVTRAVEETDDGRSYYEFDIIANDQKHELEVDASSGKITKNEIISGMIAELVIFLTTGVKELYRTTDARSAKTTAALEKNSFTNPTMTPLTVISNKMMMKTISNGAMFIFRSPKLLKQ